MPLLVLAAGAIVLLVGVVVLARLNELFCVSVRGGRALLVRGRVPPRLWTELVHVARRDRIQRGTIRAVKDGGRVRLLFDGVSDSTAQRLRNALGNAGLASMRVAEKRAPRNLGQILGVAWLAWLFASLGPRA